MVDFLIGAHAAIRGYPILTRDPPVSGRIFPMSGSSRPTPTAD
jgi:predicted nucleic acid-binding protein